MQSALLDYICKIHIDAEVHVCTRMYVKYIALACVCICMWRIICRCAKQALRFDHGILSNCQECRFLQRFIVNLFSFKNLIFLNCLRAHL